MSVLVTGGAGYIGGHMVLAFSMPARASSCSTICRPASLGVPGGATLVVGDIGDADWSPA